MSEDVIEVFLVLGAIAIALLVALWLSRRNKRRKAPAKSRHRYIQDSAVAYLAGADSGLASQPHPAPAPDSSPGFVGGGGWFHYLPLRPGSFRTCPSFITHAPL